MARRKNDDLLRVASISAVVALIVVLAFSGGSLTGNTITTQYNLNATVTGNTDCSASPATGEDLDFGTLAASSTSQYTPTISITNNGTNVLNISVTATDISSSFGGSGTIISGQLVSGQIGNGSAANGFNAAYVPITTSSTTILTGLTPIDANDNMNFTVQLDATSDSSLVAGAYQATNGLTVTCEAQ